MSKESRKIAARGLTKSSVGSIIKNGTMQVKVTDITYNGEYTIVHFDSSMSIHNMSIIEIWD